MANGSGLIGDTVSRNGGLILKDPGNQNQYYVFSTNSGSIYYSKVDMLLNFGLGDVTVRNVLITSTSDGSLAAARHSDCNNFWITTRDLNSNMFKSYLINSTGIATSPTTSICGTVNNYGPVGSTLKFSPDSKRLAGTILIGPINTYNGVLGYFEVYDFNNATGQISNAITIPDIRGPLDVAFSPNSQVLYGSSGIQVNNQLYQYDLSQTTQTNIINSQISLDSTYVSGIQGLKLGNDGKIYAIFYDVIDDSIHVIHSPNLLGTSCKYRISSFNLNGRSAGRDFPRMLSSRPQYIQFNDSCEGDTSTFSLVDPYMYSTFSWNFGDSASGANNVSTLASPKHQFSGPGFFPIRFVGLNGCFKLDTILDTVYIEPLPVLDLGVDSSICSGDTVILNAASLQSTYIWQDSTTDSTYYAFQDTTYWVEVTNGCGAVKDTIVISYRNFDGTDLGNDTSICPGDSLLLDATTPYVSYYKWQDNSTDSTLLVTNSGSYSVEIGNGCDTLFDSINVFLLTPPAINLGLDTFRCTSDTLSLDASLPGVRYLWYNGDTTQIINTTDTGIIWVDAFNNRCTARDSIVVGIYNDLSLDLGRDTMLCLGDSLILSASQNVSHTVSYRWQNNATSASQVITGSGTYWVKVSDYCMNITDSMNVVFYVVPKVNLGPDTVICFGEQLSLDAGIDGDTYLWSDLSGNQVLQVNSAGKFWVRVENNCGVKSDTIIVSLRHAPNVYLGEDTTLCMDQTMILDAYSDGATYLWQDGSTGRFYEVKNQGEYWVDVTNRCSTDNDSILAFYINKPLVDLGNDTIICLGRSITLDVTNEKASYRWNDNRSDSIRIIKDQGEYYVEVTNQCGLADDGIVVEVRDCYCALYIPNSFTPNSDNKNEVFEMKSTCRFEAFEITIFNRWGERIFTSDDPHFHWSGTYRGSSIPSGSYVYELNYAYHIDNNLIKETSRGKIVLLR